MKAYMVEISDSWKHNFGSWIAHVCTRGWHRVILSLTIGRRVFWWPSLPNQVALRRLPGSFSKHWRLHSATMKSLFAPADSLDFSIFGHVRIRSLHRVILSLTIGPRDLWWPSLPNQVAFRRLPGSFSKDWRLHSATMKSLFAPADSLDFSILAHVRIRSLHGWNKWFLKTQFWTMNRSYPH